MTLKKWSWIKKRKRTTKTTTKRTTMNKSDKTSRHSCFSRSSSSPTHIGRQLKTTRMRRLQLPILNRKVRSMLTFPRSQSRSQTIWPLSKKNTLTRKTRKLKRSWRPTSSWLSGRAVTKKLGSVDGTRSCRTRFLKARQDSNCQFGKRMCP